MCLASVAGLVAGIGVAAGLKALLAAFGIDIPAGGLRHRARAPIVISLVVGTVVTLALGVLPGSQGRQGAADRGAA